MGNEDILRQLKKAQGETNVRLDAVNVRLDAVITALEETNLWLADVAVGIKALLGLDPDGSPTTADEGE